MSMFPSPTSKWHSESYDSISPTRPELSAKGKTVVITGGGTGIGAGTALHFAQAGAARIALLGRREQPLLDTKASIESQYPGVEVLTASADITKKDEIDAAFAKSAGDGKIHVLVSNAAMAGKIIEVKDADVDEYIGAVDKNLRGSFFVAQAFLRYATEDAVVVDINSAAAHVNMTAGFGSYNVTKLAVYRFWDCLAFENPGLSVYHTQPGVVDTDMNKAAGGVKALGYEDHVNLPASFNVWLASSEARFLKNKFVWSNWDVDELKAQAKTIEGSSRFNIGLDGWPFGEGSFKADWKSE